MEQWQVSSCVIVPDGPAVMLPIADGLAALGRQLWVAVKLRTQMGAWRAETEASSWIHPWPEVFNVAPRLGRGVAGFPPDPVGGRPLGPPCHAGEALQLCLGIQSG